MQQPQLFKLFYILSSIWHLSNKYGLKSYSQVKIPGKLILCHDIHTEVVYKCAKDRGIVLLRL